MKYLDDYKNAGVPMLPVVAKNQVVARQIILYAWAYLAASLLLIPFAQMGLIYSAVALISGLWFVFEAQRLYREAKTSRYLANPMRLFHSSITQLTVLFIAVAIDPLIYL